MMLQSYFCTAARTLAFASTPSPLMPLENHGIAQGLMDDHNHDVLAVFDRDTSEFGKPFDDDFQIAGSLGPLRTNISPAPGRCIHALGQIPHGKKALGL